eukprot:5981893-Pyramimonas_sp.AAC.1
MGYGDMVVVYIVWSLRWLAAGMLGRGRSDSSERSRRRRRLPLAERRREAAAGGATPFTSRGSGAGLSLVAPLPELAACSAILISDGEHGSPTACDGDDHCSSADYGGDSHDDRPPASGVALRCERSRSRERPREAWVSASSRPAAGGVAPAAADPGGSAAGGGASAPSSGPAERNRRASDISGGSDTSSDSGASDISDAFGLKRGAPFMTTHCRAPRQ